MVMKHALIFCHSANMLNMRSRGILTVHNDYDGIYLANLSKQLPSTSN